MKSESLSLTPALNSLPFFKTLPSVHSLIVMTNNSQAIESLAAEIGDRVYIDVAKWHLYLEDAKLHVVLAERLYPMLSEGRLDDSQILQVLQDISIPLGGGRRQLPLADLLPQSCHNQLTDILEEFQRQM
jgi:Protein of unknown function (DUF3181)